MSEARGSGPDGVKESERAELHARRKQYEYCRDKLLTSEELS